MGIELEVTSESRKARDDLQKIVTSLSNIERASAKVSNIKLDSNAAATRQQMTELKNAVNNVTAATANAVDGFKSMAISLAAAVVSAATLDSIVKLTDSLTTMRSRMRVALDGTGDFQRGLEDVGKIALSTRASLDSVNDLYTKMARSTKVFGIGQDKVAIATQTVGKAIALSGSGAVQAEAAIMQLGQALSSGTLAGDELRSIKENASELAETIARGLGVTIGQLSAMGEAGQLNTQKVFGAILSQTDAVNAKFSKINVTFASAFTNVGSAFKLLIDTVMNSGTSAKGGNKLVTFINNIALTIYDIAINFDAVMLRIHASLLDLANTTYRSFMHLFDSIATGYAKVSSMFKTSLVLDIKAVDISNFFPKLDTVLDTVKQWAITVERWFFWIYDRVIGHSWIPDLVDGVFLWMSKLIGKPLSYVKEFATAVSDLFLSILKLSPFGALISVAEKAAAVLAALFAGGTVATKDATDTISSNASNQLSKLLENIRSSIKTIASTISELFTDNVKSAIILFIAAAAAVFTSGIPRIIAVIGTAVLGLRAIMKSSVFSMASTEKVPGEDFKPWEDKKESTGIFSSILEFLKEQLGPTLSKIVDGYSSLIRYLNNTSIVHAVKQMMGLPDRFEYTWKNVKGTYSASDTESQVAVGPKRKNDSRFIGHDFVNALPEKMQIPLITAVTAAVGAGIVLAVSGGPVRTVLLSVLTTAWGLAVGQIVQPSVIEDFSNSITGIFRKGATGFVEVLFGSGLFGDKGFGGTLALLWKISLLFSAGREATINAITKVAAAPTKIALEGMAVLDQRRAAKDLEKLDKTIKDLPASLTNIARDRSAAQAKASNTLVLARRQQTANPTNASANALVSEASKRLADATNAVAVSRKELADLPAKLAQMGGTRDSLSKLNDSLKERLSNNRAELKSGTIKAAASVGGVFGSLAGFKVGSEIAEGMTNSPEWAKMGVQLSAAFLGQALLGGLAGLLAQAVMFALGGAMTILLSPVVLAVTAVGLAIWGAYEAWKNWDKLGPILNTFLADMKILIPKLASDFGDTLLAKLGLGKTEKQKAAVEDHKTAAAGVTTAQDKLENATTNSEIISAIKQRNTADAAELAALRERSANGTPGISAAALRHGGLYAGRQDVDDSTRAENLAFLNDWIIAPLKNLGNQLLDITGIFGRLWDRLRQNPFGLSTDTPKDGTIAKPASGFDKYAVEPAKRLVNQLWDLPRTVARLIDNATPDLISSAHGSSPIVNQGSPIASTPAIDTAALSASISENFVRASSAANLVRASDNAIAAVNEDTRFKAFIDAIKSRESGGSKDPSNAKSPQGAIGSMQIIEGTFNAFKKSGEVFTNELDRIAVATRYARKIYDDRKGDVKLAAAAYIGGEGASSISNGIMNPDIRDKAGGKNGGTSRQEYADQVYAKFEKLSGEVAKPTTIAEKALVSTKDFASAISEAFRTKSIVPITAALAELSKQFGFGPKVKTDEAPAEIPDIVDYSLTKRLSGIATKDGVFEQIKKAMEEVNAIPFPKELFDSLSPANLSSLVEELDGVIKYQKEAEHFTAEGSTFFAIKNQALADKYKTSIEDLRKRLESSAVSAMGTEYKGPSPEAQLAGVEYAKQFRTETAKSFADVLKGKTTFPKFLSGALDSFTTNILDQFAKGFVNKFTESFDIDALMGSATTGVFDLGEKLSLAFKSLFSTTAKAPVAAIDNPLANTDYQASDFRKLVGLGRPKTVADISTPTPGYNPYPDVAKTSEAGIVAAVAASSVEIQAEQRLNVEAVTAQTDTLATTFKAGFTEMKTGFSSFGMSLQSILTGAGLGGSIGGAIGGKSGAAWGSALGAGIGAIGSSASWKAASVLADGNFLETASTWLSALFIKDGGLAHFASGGFSGVLQGAGTGTSDSIPAMLSNGEFIVNAAATRNNRELLEAINSGTFSRFATGGLAGNIPGSISTLQPNLATVTTGFAMLDKGPEKKSVSSQSTFNINVTGDISRQTRHEIMTMIPQIATGVGAHNYEKGNR